MRVLDTAQLGPIRVSPLSPIRVEARRLLAQAIRDGRHLGANAADSVRDGSYGNAWTEAALLAIERALRQGPGDE